MWSYYFKQADYENFRRVYKPLIGYFSYVFMGISWNKPISKATTNAALKRMGIDTKNEITSYGFRAVARTLLHEVLGYEPDIIEHQLAHKVPW